MGGVQSKILFFQDTYTPDSRLQQYRRIQNEIKNLPHLNLRIYHSFKTSKNIIHSLIGQVFTKVIIINKLPYIM